MIVQKIDQEILQNYKHKIDIIYHNKNSGKGAAIQSALKVSTGDIIIIQDADLEYDPNDYQKLINPILAGKTKVVYGSRVLNKKDMKVLLLHYLESLQITY